MDELVKRCSAICGDDRTGCFVTNANHLECITDIIVNKIWAARAVIEMGTRDSTCEHMAGILNVAANEMDELINWVKEMPTLQKMKTHEINREVLWR
jgi:hypothetical protein